MKNLYTLLVLSLLTVPSFAARYHVKTTGSDAAAGTNWTAAFATLQKALATAASGDEIWVAAGTYYPDEGGAFSNNDRNAHFTMKNGVAIYGGFPAAGNPTMTNRDWVNHPTTLSGEIQQDNDISNNTYNIIYNFFNNLDTTSLLDGFTVSGGHANGIDYRTLHGGGVHNRNTAPAFQNCTFSGNRSIAHGGGMYNEESSPTLTNCSFQANEAREGGGMLNDNTPPFTLTNCSFSGNKARQGGGIYTTFIYSLNLINCSFSANQAETGGALYNTHTSSLTNCIVWGNSNPQVSNPGGVHVYSHCLIEGLNPPGVGNLDGTQPSNNPLFVSQPDFNAAPTNTGNLRLQPCSPAVNAGTNGTFTNADKDLDGNARIVNTTVDLGAYEAPAAAVFHVKPTGSDANNGLCWNTAFRTLQKALESAFSGTTIWVASGTYYPDEGPGVTDNDRNAHFTMKNGVAIYGGFPALGNPVMTDRDWVINPTILSGEIQQDNAISNNTYNIIYNFFNNLDATSLLDGFTVSNGYANGIEYRTQHGAGVHNRNTNPVYQNCTFSGNQSNLHGGGMYNEGASPTLINCSFQANQAVRGGGIYNVTIPQLKLTNCSFLGNKAGAGGGVYSAIVSTFTLTNCSFSGNKAETDGALYNSRVSSLTLTNCIIWGNSNPQMTASGVGSVYSHCLIEGLNPPGVGNLDGTQPSNNPLFVSQPDFNAAPTTIGNLRLQLCSPAINAGTNGSFTNADKDLDNNPRLFNGIVDLGAYEVQAIKSIPTATISGSATVCQNASAPPITFTGSSGTTPYTFTYTINGGSPQTVSTSGSNSSVTIYQSTANAGIFNYTLTNVSDANGCSKNHNETSAVTVYPMPTATISGTATVCQNAPAPPITFTGSDGTAPYTFTYTIDGESPQTISSGGSNSSTTISQSTANAGSFNYTLTNVSDANGCSKNQNGTTAVTVYPMPMASISGTNTVCQNTTALTITFTGSNGSIPYTFTYQINAGSPQTISTTGSNTNVTITQATNAAGSFSYTLLSVSDAHCSQNQGGNATVIVNPAHLLSLTSAIATESQTGCRNLPITPITYAFSGGATGVNVTGLPTGVNAIVSENILTISGIPSVSGVFNFSISTTGNSCASVYKSGTMSINTKPIITLTVIGQTLNEGNNPIICDADANPVNPLQFTVLSSCVAGNPVWRVQVGNGAWSSWSNQTPVIQPSNNTAYRYQAACDASCPSTYTNPIEATINYRASLPQNVSLIADGITVNAGESKTICNLEGNTLTFNATCASGEILLYSIDGGDYSPAVPSQIVDNNFHNYRVRCRKADSTPSCLETESAAMSLKITTAGPAPAVSISPMNGCGTPTSFSGSSNCGALTTIWYNAATNQALPTLPTTTPNQTTSFYARCQNTASTGESGCLSENSNTVTFTITPVNDPPVVSASAEIVCTGTPVTISANCPNGSTAFWNTGVTTNSFQVAFSNVTQQSYWAKCIFPNGCQSPESTHKTIFWKAFELTFINIGQSQSATKPANDRNLWTGQFITKDAGPVLENSTEANPTIYYSENVNKTAPRFWTIQTETCALGTNGSVTYDLLATPEVGIVRSYNTHENNAPYLMYANREGFTELYAQNHPAYGFYQDNGSGGNVYDTGLPKGLYKLGIRYWDQKGQGSIYPSTRQPAGNVLAYQEYWFRIQSQNGVGAGAARSAAENGQRRTENGAFAQVMPNPVSNTLHVKVNEAQDQKVNMSLVDASGRTLLQRAFVPQTNQHQEEFQVSDLVNGMYFLRVNSAHKQAILKVVKVQ